MRNLRFFLLPLLSCVYGATAIAKDKAEVTIFAVNYPVVAYVLDSEPDVATTYLVACPKGIATSSCLFNQPYTLTQGPKTLRFEFTAAAQQLTLACDLAGTSSMGCKATGPNTISPSAVTTEAFTWTGANAISLFRSVALVTDSALLMTLNRTPKTTSGEQTVVKTSTNVVSPTPLSTTEDSSTTATITSTHVRINSLTSLLPDSGSSSVAAKATGGRGDSSSSSPFSNLQSSGAMQRGSGSVSFGRVVMGGVALAAAVIVGL